MRTNLLLACGVLSPAIYIAGDLFAARLYPGFSYTDQAVSELFAIGAPTAGLVVALFSVSSALLLPFAAGLWLQPERRRLLRIAAVMIACDAIDSLVLWNFFPMHMRGAEKTLTDTMHLVLASNPFVLISLVLGAVAFRGWFRRYSIATILLGLALALHAFSLAPALAALQPTPGLGLSERMAQYANGAWMAVLAVMLMRRGGAGAEGRRFAQPQTA